MRICAQMASVSGNPEMTQQTSPRPSTRQVLVTVLQDWMASSLGPRDQRPSGWGRGSQQDGARPSTAGAGSGSVFRRHRVPGDSGVSCGVGGGQTTSQATSPGGRTVTQDAPLGLWDIY